MGIKILKFFDVDPGWKEFGSDGIRDKHPGSATLFRPVATIRSKVRQGQVTIKERYIQYTVRHKIFISEKDSDTTIIDYSV